MQNEKIKAKIEKLKLEFELRKLQRIKKILNVQQKYDALKHKKQRRTPIIEKDGEKLSTIERAWSCNYARDLERNYAPVAGALEQIKINVVGANGGKIKINTKDAQEAVQWYNSVWAKDCDFREPGMHWSDWLMLVVVSVIRDGDILISVDNGLVDESVPKIMCWESDQIVPLAPSIFSDEVKKKNIPENAVQDGGIIRDEYGRVIAYVVTSEYGKTTIDNENYIILKSDVAKLVKLPIRHNQGRGISMLLTSASNYFDLYEILTAELISAKRASQQYAYVKRENPVMDWDLDSLGKELLPENVGKTAEQVEAEKNTAPVYEGLEQYTGGITDYLDPGDTVTLVDPKRPNANLSQFIETVLGFSGARLGLAATYTKMRADTSYTAFRGDMLLTWQMFYRLQKWLERSVCDWVAIRVLKFAQRKKIIPALPSGWEKAISWGWQKMPEVNVVDAENATAQALKNATTNYAEILGPDWEEKLESYAKQIQVVRQLKLPLSVLETKSGGITDA